MTNIFKTIRAEFPRRKIVVVGDLVADQFLRGTINRVSREAPVFILRHDETETLAGGAANAATNVAGLGAHAILIGVTGEDANGHALLEKLEGSRVDCRFSVASADFQTTTKVRVLAGQHYAPRQQVIRIDYENKTGIAEDLRARLKANLLEAAREADAIILSDYDLGVVTPEMFETAKKIAAESRIPLILDSRFRLKEFYGATSATPNQDEVEQILGGNFTQDQCTELREKLGLDAFLMTCGNKGMLLFEKNKTPLQIEAVGSKEPVDVTGAGDTVIAAYALALASGLSFAESARLANHAGGIVVMKRGTAAVSPEELLDSVSGLQNEEQTAAGQ